MIGRLWEDEGGGIIETLPSTLICQRETINRAETERE
jgi:hypothetical protein